MRKKSMQSKGFTLIELMIVIAIIAILAMIALPNFTKLLAKTKRAEAYMNLNALYLAQKSYWAEHGRYSPLLSGKDSIHWQPEGYRGGGEQENFYYTYGTATGSEGTHFFTGKLKTSMNHLSGGHADDKSFLMFAAGDIDNDGTPDVLSIDHNKVITIVTDDLAD
jgi:prepilin-type N-terminal cleavage/methylation domain-containing protein